MRPSRAPVSVWMISDLGRHSDRFTLLADLQLDVDAAIVGRADGDSFLFVGLEPGELDLHVVGAGEDAAEDELAAPVTDGGLHRLRAGVGQRDGGTRQDAAGRILDRASDASCR